MITITAKEISQRLVSRVEGLAKQLYPNGKESGGNWCVGGVQGASGDSMKIQLTGSKAGLWADFASNESGDLLDLIAAAKGLKMGEAIRFAKDYLGITDPQSTVPPKSYAKPKPKNVSKPVANSAVVDYLIKERKLNVLTVMMFRVSEYDHRDFGPCMAYPSFNPEGELVNVKYIAIKRKENGKKNVWQEAGCAPALFGWHAFDKQDYGNRSVVITEGQLDAMTWRQAGVPVLSVPDGTASADWIDYEWDNLQQFDVIYLNYDDDEAGQKAVKAVAARLGLPRCMILKLPGFKDANEALQAGKDEDFFIKALAGAKALTPEKIKSPQDFRDKVQDKFYPLNNVPVGFFPLITERRLGLRPGEVTVWTGISSHGKSAALNQIMLEALLSAERVAIASMEMRGEQTLHRMICQSEMTNRPDPSGIDSILQWLGGKLWIYDLSGNVSPKFLLELMYYSYSRHGVTHFVIDSLMKCQVGTDDYEAQRQFLNTLCSFAMETGTHVHLVAHSNKGDSDETKSPGKLNVKGSSDIINQCDNIVVVWRNLDKEEKVAENKVAGLAADAMADSIFRVVKQRENGDQFKVSLRYSRGIFRFYPVMGVMQDLSILGLLDSRAPVVSPEPSPEAEPQQVEQEFENLTEPAYVK